LLADSGEDVVVVHRSSRQKPELDLRVRRLETFAGPTSGTDGDERLVDRPRGTLLVDIGMDKGRESLLLIRF